MANNNWSTQHNWSNSDHSQWQSNSAKGNGHTSGHQSNYHNAARRTTTQSNKVECHHCHRLNDKSADNCWYCRKPTAHSSKVTKGSGTKGGKGKGSSSSLPPADPLVQRVIDEIPPATLREIRSHSCGRNGASPQ